MLSHLIVFSVFRMHGNRFALRRAQYAIDNYFEVVGVLEEFNKSLAVFEDRLPDFFAGVRSIQVNGGK